MKRPKEEELISKLPVDEMLQLNTLLFSNFADDKAAFIAKVPDLDGNFLADWQKNTEDYYAIESDDDFIDSQLLMSQDLEELMVKGRDQLQTIYFYVERAYPGDKAKLSYFGKDRYEVSRKNPLKLHELMLKCCDAVIESEYKDALTEKGLTPNLCDEMKITAKQIKEKFNSRDKYISNRKILTEKRNIILNKIWKNMSDVSEASKLVYKNDFAKFQQYKLYHSKLKNTVEFDDEILPDTDTADTQ